MQTFEPYDWGPLENLGCGQPATPRSMGEIMGGTILTGDIKDDEHLYRIIPLRRFYDLFRSHQNALVRPKLWDDPFENLALNSQCVSASNPNQVGTFSFKDDVYAQCWTRHKASDAMWRIYSKGPAGTDGVRIRTTARKLLDALAASQPQFHTTSCFLGTVSYMNDQQMQSFAQTHFANGLGTDGKLIAETMMIKRMAFAHEKEVRLIFIEPNSSPMARDLYPYAIDPHAMIDQVMLHPRLDASDAAQLKADIATKTGFRGQVLQSMMYSPPQGFHFVIP